MKITSVISRILITAVFSFWVYTLFTIWKNGLTNVGLGLFFAVAGSAYLWYRKAGWPEVKYLVYLTGAYAAIAVSQLYFGRAILDNRYLKFFIGAKDAPGLVGFLITVLLCYALAYAVAKRFTLATSGRQWLWVNVAASVALSLYYAILMLLDYQSFRAPFFDLAIFDQAIYQLSRFHLPASSARQFVNLWHDHQHFSLVFLAPLYWLKPMATYLLISVTPFLLITLPSLVLYKAFLLAERLFFAPDSQAKHYWIIGFSSFLLWLHPYTQSATAFYFHEKYLMPVTFGLLAWAFLKYLQTSKWLYLGLTIFFNIAWLGIKEDQWLFVVLFWVQTAILIMFFAKRYRKQLLVGAAGAVIGLVYVFAFLPWYQSRSSNNQQYTALYDQSKTALIEFTKDGQPVKLLTTLKAYDDVNKYIYQNFLIFDLPGLALFPVNTFANYGERLLSSDYSQKNPVFHYGVDVPIYSAAGLLFLMLLLKKRRRLDLKKQAAFIAVLYILGFGSVLGWNNDYYLNTRLLAFLDNYRNSRALRADYNHVKKLIPAGASVAATDALATYFSKRTEIAEFPQRIILPENTPGRNDLNAYEYWILRTDVPVENTKAAELQNANYRVLYQGSQVIVLKKP